MICVRGGDTSRLKDTLFLKKKFELISCFENIVASFYFFQIKFY